MADGEEIVQNSLEREREKERERERRYRGSRDRIGSRSDGDEGSKGCSPLRR